MTWKTLLILAAVFLFVLAALSAFTDSVNINETGLLAIGLACFAGAHLGVSERTVG